MLSNTANTNYGVDLAFAIILGMCAVLFLLVVGLMVVFVIRFHRSRAPRPRRVRENVLLELTWTIVPLILVMVMFWFGYAGHRTFRRTTFKDAFEVTVYGRMWQWEFEYPNGVSLTHDLYLPAGRPINLKILSRDVNHSFFIPAFRIKQDAVPGFENHMQFKVNEPGVYDIYCAEYCGLQHAYMLGKVHVLERGEFDAWMADRLRELEQAKDAGLRADENTGQETAQPASPAAEPPQAPEAGEN
ncbi:MAG: hypothetical protein Kow0059_20230 [Candidatus Sumerlaeia bacterium]